MKSERRQQANHGVRNDLCHERKRVVLTDRRVRQGVDSSRRTAKQTLAEEPAKVFSGDSSSLHVSRPHKRLDSRYLKNRCRLGSNLHIATCRYFRIYTNVMSGSGNVTAAGWSACFEGAMALAARKMKITLPPETG
jgi:hypothetical protein